ncbi:hypothetical protein C0J52_22800 [Blattella germanica]|nr:hypothetical protein C0J52_22800 [Blattella germanica]
MDNKTDDRVPPSVDMSSLSKMLTCPLCEELLMFPTTVCETGHTFCKCCIEEKTNCPICEKSFLVETRNIPIEIICEEIGNLCPNKDNGCNYTMTKPLLQGHIPKCLHRSVDCPLKNMHTKNCNWEGAIKNLAQHLLQMHKKSVSQKNYIMSLSLQAEFRFIIHKNEVFHFYKYCKDDIWYAIVQSAGVTLTNFKSVFGFRSWDEKTHMISFTFPVTNISENIDDVVDKGQAMILDDVVVKNYVGKNGLNMMAGVEEII